MELLSSVPTPLPCPEGLLFLFLGIAHGTNVSQEFLIQKVVEIPNYHLIYQAHVKRSVTLILN